LIGRLITLQSIRSAEYTAPCIEPPRSEASSNHTFAFDSACDDSLQS